MPAGPVSRPWRRYVWFGVRGLIVLVLLLCFWLVWNFHLAGIQREAVLAIEKDGGTVLSTGNGTMGVLSRPDNLWRCGGLWLESESISSVMSPL